MSTKTLNMRWSATDALAVYRNIIGAPVCVSDESLGKALCLESSTGDGFVIGDALREGMGLSPANADFSAGRFSDWRVLEREVSGTLAMLRSYFQLPELETPEGRKRFSSAIRQEVGILAKQRVQLNELCRDGELRSAKYYMSEIGPLIHPPRSSWHDDVLTPDGLQRYRKGLRGLDGPLGFLEDITGGLNSVNVKLDMDIVPGITSAHALSTRHMFEELVEQAHMAGSPARPINLVVRCNWARNTLDIEAANYFMASSGTEALDDLRLFSLLRSDFGSERTMREIHDGWWLEGNRIVVPLKPFHYFSVFESLQRKVWQRASRVVGHFEGRDYEGWKDDLRWLGEALEEGGLLHRFGRDAYKQGTHEGYMVNRLLAGLKNFLCPIYNAYIAYQGDPSGEGNGVRDAIAGVVSHGFPGRMNLLRLVGNVLGGQTDKIFRNLKVVVKTDGDVGILADKQYAAKRFFDDLLIVASQFEAANGPIVLSLSCADEGRQLMIDNRGGMIVRFFSESSKLLPKFAHEILELAKYISSDGEGLHFDRHGESMWIAIQSDEDGQSPAERPLSLEPAPGVLTSGLVDLMLVPGLVTFYPSLNPRVVRPEQ